MSVYITMSSSKPTNRPAMRWRLTRTMQQTPLRSREIVPFLKPGFGSSAFPIYRAALLMGNLLAAHQASWLLSHKSLLQSHYRDHD